MSRKPFRMVAVDIDGTLLCPAGKVTPRTKAILEFNRLLYSATDLVTTILPVRDGVAVAVKK